MVISKPLLKILVNSGPRECEWTSLYLLRCRGFAVISLMSRWAGNKECLFSILLPWLIFLIIFMDVYLVYCCWLVSTVTRPHVSTDLKTHYVWYVSFTGQSYFDNVVPYEQSFCNIPLVIQGEWFSRENGGNTLTVISSTGFSNRGRCLGMTSYNSDNFTFLLNDG